MVLTVAAMYIGALDRLPTYIIALGALFKNPFLLGVCQYFDYIENS